MGRTTQQGTDTCLEHGSLSSTDNINALLRFVKRVVPNAESGYFMFTEQTKWEVQISKPVRIV